MTMDHPNRKFPRNRQASAAGSPAAFETGIKRRGTFAPRPAGRELRAWMIRNGRSPHPQSFTLWWQRLAAHYGLFVLEHAERKAAWNRTRLLRIEALGHGFEVIELIEESQPPLSDARMKFGNVESILDGFLHALESFIGLAEPTQDFRLAQHE